MINIIKYIQCLLLAACVVQNVALGESAWLREDGVRRRKNARSAPAPVDSNQLGTNAASGSNPPVDATLGSANTFVWLPEYMLPVWNGHVYLLPVWDGHGYVCPNGYVCPDGRYFPFPTQPLQTMPPHQEPSSLNQNAAPFVPGSGSSGHTFTHVTTKRISYISTETVKYTWNGKGELTRREAIIIHNPLPPLNSEKFHANSFQTNEAESGGAAKSTGPKRQPKQPCADCNDSDSDRGQGPWNDYPGNLEQRAGASSAAASSDMHNRAVGNPGDGRNPLLPIICKGLNQLELKKVEDFCSMEPYGEGIVVVTPSKEQSEWSRNNHSKFLKFFKDIMNKMPQGKIRDCMIYSRIRLFRTSCLAERVYIFYIPLSDCITRTSKVILANCQYDKPIICQISYANQLIITIPAECADVDICQPIVRQAIEGLFSIFGCNINYIKFYKFCAEKAKEAGSETKSKLWIMLGGIFYELSPKQQSA